MQRHQSIGRLMVKIVAFQVSDRGSIPRQCNFVLLYDTVSIRLHLTLAWYGALLRLRKKIFIRCALRICADTLLPARFKVSLLLN